MVSLPVVPPLLVAVALSALLLAAAASERVDTALKRTARVAFGRFVDEGAIERQRLLQSAYVAETYGTYAATTYLYAVVLAVVGGIVGGLLAGAVVLAVPAIGDFLSGLPRPITAVMGTPSTWELDLSERAFSGLVLASGLVAAAFTGIATYSLRWRLLAGRAEARRRRINESLARTVAFLFALSRGGMAFPVVMRTLSDNRRIYGETAAEISVAVREIDLFGTDVINAIQRTTRRTPSEEFKTFGENLASVLQSGQNLPRFLEDQYERYMEEAEQRQEAVLELLAMIAEAYVTVFVAGTLFLITILLVFGLTMADTLWIIQLLAYLAIPLANLGFIAFLDRQLSLLGIGTDDSTAVPDDSLLAPSSQDPTADVSTADGGYAPALAANFERLAAYDRLDRYWRVLRRPGSTVLRNPASLLYVTVPLAVVVTVARLPEALTGVGVNVRTLDDLLIQAALFVMGTYAVVRFVSERRLGRVEAATPEFLERLATLNESGMSVVGSINRVRGSDMGALTEEGERIWADVSLGANVEAALLRFGRRVRTTPVTRAVTLLTNAMRASGNIAVVLRIAANQARSDLRMKRRRRQQMLTYLVVIYVSFAVFLIIIIAVQEVLIPSLPESVPAPPSDNRLGVDADQFTRFGGLNKAAYTLVFFHTAMIQAVLSGLIGGQLGEGSVRDGVKHAAIMLGIAYVAFLLLSSPVATIDPGPQAETDRVTIDSAELSKGGFVVVHAFGPEGEVVGRSEYLPAGKSRDVTIQLDREVPEGTTVYVVPHLDTNGDREFDYAGGDVDRLYPPNREAVVAQVRLPADASHPEFSRRAQAT